MFKRLFSFIKKNSGEEKNEEIVLSQEKEVSNEVEETLIEEEDSIEIGEESLIEEEDVIEIEEESLIEEEDIIEIEEEILAEENDSIKITEEIEDSEYIKEIKIKRGRSIKAIDLYTEEEQIFKTHIECSRKLKIPLGYIKENLKYEHTDYLGEAINYLSKELEILEDNEDELAYLDNSKNPIELFNILNNKIFTSKISESKRDNILLSEKIEPIKMHYKFECIDTEYDDYFKKYKSIIKRGGKKKIELVNTKDEVIEIFRSLEECALYLKKEKSEVVDMLKYGEVKVGRYQIRYSLRNI